MAVELGGSALSWDHDAAVPFAQALMAFAVPARERVESCPEVAPTLGAGALDELTVHLLQRLAFIAAEPLLSLFESERARGRTYRDFVRDELSSGLDRLCGRYPAAVRLMALVADHWSDAVAELAERLDDDRRILAESFGWGWGEPLVTKVSRPLGDAHNGGRQVIRLTDHHGTQLIYKPRSMAPEAAYGRVLEWANSQPIRHQLKVPLVVDRGGYGWMEHVSAGRCVDADAHRRYSRRAGTQLSLLRLLGATDLHVENMIAAGEHPVMVDLECIVQPRLHAGLIPYEGRAAEMLPDSVMFTGLLPGALPARGGLTVDLSGLGGQASQVTGTMIPKWLGLGTDEIALGEVMAETPPSQNQPAPGQVASVADLVAGYEEMDAMLAANEPPLAEFEQLSTRVVFRATPIYARLIRAAVRPEVLEDESRFDEAIGVLDDWASDLAASCAEPEDARWARRIVAAERQAVAELEIPWFLADVASGAVRTASADVAPDAFVDSGLAGLERRRRLLGRRDTRLQTDLIRIAMEGSGATRPSGTPGMPEAPGETKASVAPAGPTTSADMLERAREIGHRLSERAVRSSSGEASWLDVTTRGNTTTWVPIFDLAGFYAGSAGVAVFAAALGSRTGDEEYVDLASAALAAPLEVPDDRRSDLALWELSAGLSGRAYARALVGGELDRPGLVSEARECLRRFEVPEIVPAEPLDVIGGWAGVALGIVAVAQRAGDEDLLDRASTIAHRMVDSVHDRSGPRWPAGYRRLGFAHGGTGIAYVLARIGTACDDSRLIEAARDFVVAENARAAKRDLPARRRSRSAHTQIERGWCWGTAGFALARIRLDALLGAEAAEHLQPAIAHTASGHEGNHRLCCGIAGQVEALVEAQVAPSDLSRIVEALVVDTDDLVLEPSVSFRGPSLFRGLSGIGYTLLRAHDQSLPSVLMVD
ncbi:MAG: type 2 lanthipeptide synthetase LanM [Acidimicrobiales bacterium]